MIHYIRARLRTIQTVRRLLLLKRHHKSILKTLQLLLPPLELPRGCVGNLKFLPQVRYVDYPLWPARLIGTQGIDSYVIIDEDAGPGPHLHQNGRWVSQNIVIRGQAFRQFKVYDTLEQMAAAFAERHVADILAKEAQTLYTT